MEVALARGLIVRAIDCGKCAAGYLVCGDPRGNCMALVEAVLEHLFPDAAEQIARRTHPDVVYLSPQGRAKKIKVERGKEDDGPGMRDGLVEPMSVTSYSGGWKVGVIVSADRMNNEAANAFLKLLEEPPPRTVFFLLTDSPDSILPTIISRTQRIDLPRPSALLEGDAYDDVAEAMSESGVKGVCDRARVGRRLAEIFGELAEDESEMELSELRKRFFATVLSFVRAWMAEGRLPRFQAFHNVRAVEEAYADADLSVNAETVLSFMTDRMFFP